MRVFDVQGETHVSTPVELERVLDRRDERNANEFWIAWEENYPVLVIAVRGDLATMMYYESEGHAGHRSLSGAEPEGTTTFFLHGEPEDVPNRLVVGCKDAVAAAREFMMAKVRPETPRWLTL